MPGGFIQSYDTMARQRTMVMLRSMSDDVSNDFRVFLEEIYDAEHNELGKKCARWHWKIVRFSFDEKKAMGLVAMIMYSFELDYDFTKDNNWLRMIRMILPSEFVKMFKASFTQVPRMALLNDTSLDKTTKEKHMFTDIRMV